jgi:hypothetical protein
MVTATPPRTRRSPRRFPNAFALPSASHHRETRCDSDERRIGDATFVWTPHLYGAGRLIVLYVGSQRTSTRDALDDLFGKQFAGV